MNRRITRPIVLALLFLVGIASIPHLSLAEAARLRLGSDVWPPFTDQEGKRRVAIELVEHALERADRSIAVESIILTEARSLTDRLKAGTLDGSAAFWHTPERESYLLYSRPYLENRLVLLARKGTDVSAASWQDLEDRKVGIVSGYAYTEQDDLSQETGNEVLRTGPVFLESTSDQENLQRLLRGEIEFMLADELVVHEFFERHGERADMLLVAGTTPLIKRSLHLVLRSDLPNAPSIIEEFDRAIREMVADGTFNDALGLVWLRVDLDGDGKSELVLGGTRGGTTSPTDGYAVFGDELDRRVPESNPDYVVGGKRYRQWAEVPSEFKRPIEKNEAWPEPTIRLLEF